MLDELSVANLGIIDTARVGFMPGMVVVSGETGAGKTLMLGALRMLAGAPARSALIGPHGKEARVEGRFFLDGEEVVLARSIHPGGSRAYLDGRMVPARALAERLDGVVEIVGQHDPIAITRPRAVRALIDLQLESDRVVAGYAEAWRALCEVEALRTELGGDMRALEREMDLLAYQVGEIDRADFHPGEDMALELEARRLGNAEEVADLLAEAHRDLGIARDRVGPVVDAARRVRDLDPSRGGLTELVEALDATLTDTLSATREAWEGTEPDPEALARANQRLNLLGDLRRKYGSDIEEIHSFRHRAATRLAKIAGLIERASRLDGEHVAATGHLLEAGRELRVARRDSATRISESACRHLRELGFGDPLVRVEIGEAEPRPFGADTVELLFASDSRLVPGPVGKVASGGELSRLVLALRLASGTGAARIVAFDEIDSGVGGTTALAMGAKLARLSEDRQILCVSHLPQVAAFADSHIVVEREGPRACVRIVEEDARLRELSRMLSGLADSERGHHHARELRSLAMARRAPLPTG